MDVCVLVSCRNRSKTVQTFEKCLNEMFKFSFLTIIVKYLLAISPFFKHIALDSTQTEPYIKYFQNDDDEGVHIHILNDDNFLYKN